MPLNNLGLVHAELWRCAQPGPDGFASLSGMRVTTIIKLNDNGEYPDNLEKANFKGDVIYDPYPRLFTVPPKAKVVATVQKIVERLKSGALCGAIAPALAKLLAKVDFRSKCSPVENQGSLGSCTANALASALEFLELKDGATFVDLSRLFIYYDECVIEGTVNEDSGAFIRDGIKSLAKQGACSEQSWPYAVSDFKKKPSASCYATARKHRIKSYHRINLRSDLKN